MIYMNEDVLNLLKKIPKEHRKIIAAELTLRGCNVNECMVPMLRIYLTAATETARHMEKMIEVLLPALMKQQELQTQNELALGLTPTFQPKEKRDQDESRTIDKEVKKLQER